MTLIELMESYQAPTAYRLNDMVGLKNRNTRLYDWFRFCPGQGYVQVGSTMRLPMGTSKLG